VAKLLTYLHKKIRKTRSRRVDERQFEQNKNRHVTKPAGTDEVGFFTSDCNGT
jgi:hypothetical protein